MARGRQMPGDKDMAQIIDPAHVAVDVAVAQDGLVGQVTLSGQQGMDGILDRHLDPVAHAPDLGPKFGQIMLQAFLVVFQRLRSYGYRCSTESAGVPCGLYRWPGVHMQVVDSCPPTLLSVCCFFRVEFC